MSDQPTAMLVVRSVRAEDLDPLFDLIQQSELGLTTLKISRDKLSERIDASLAAFAQKKARPAGQPYVFVMEDLANGLLVGTSSIYSKVGGFEPFYSYRIETAIHESEELGVRKEIQTLHLQEDHNGPTELGSLFLSPDYWGNGHGRLLSMARFLFMADFPERFEKKVIAEMRGVVHADGHSPLWAALGSHFFQIGFPRAETLTSESKKFIADLMPRHPIYIPLLPPAAQSVIGEVHPNTRPALAMLKKEGFAYRQIVDVFDGGPTIEAKMDSIRSVKNSRRLAVRDIVRDVQGKKRLLVANERLDFRACLAVIDETAGESPETGTAVIDQVTALQLELTVGDSLRAVELRPAGS